MSHCANWGAALALIFTAGCQTVPRQPIDLPSTYAQLRNRDLNVQQVREFLSGLATVESSELELFDAANGITLREAEAIALWYNAELRVARAQAARAGAVSATTGRWSDPDFKPGVGRKWFDGQLDPSWVGDLSLSITIPTSGRTAAERKSRQAEFDATRFAIDEAEWKLIRELRTAWVEWSEAVNAVQLLNDHLALMEPLAAAASELAGAGETDPGTARLFSIEVGRKKAMTARAEVELGARRARILRLMGLVPDVDANLIPRLLDSRHPELARLDVHYLVVLHPAVVLRRAEYDAAEARLRLELRKQYPDITIAPSFSSERDESSFNVGFGLPIPVWNANRQGIVDALGAREIARAEIESAVLSAAEEIAAAQTRFDAAQVQREGLTAEVVPDVDKQIEESRALVRSGELDLATLFQVLQQAYDVKRELLAVIADEQSAALFMRQILALPSLDTSDGPENER